MKVEINGEAREIEAGDGTTVELVRDELGLTGTKLVCGGGVCGACTVHLDGRAVASCLRTAPPWWRVPALGAAWFLTEFLLIAVGSLLLFSKKLRRSPRWLWEWTAAPVLWP